MRGARRLRACGAGGMKVNSYACDNCGKQRDRDTNHWFMLQIVSSSIYGDRAEVFTWDQEFDTEATSHACGHECALSMLARFLANGKFERVKVREDALV